MLTLDILRHGALEGGVRYRGLADDPLTIDGCEAMKRVWAELDGEIELIVTSPLRRCAEPARTWAESAGIDCIIEPRVAEIHYGEWEGKTIPEIQQQYPGILEQWRANPEGMRPPGGESPEELLVRLKAWWQEAYEAHHGKHLLLVTHSGSMRMLIAHLLGGTIASSRKLAMPYACWSRIVCSQGETTLAFHNREP